VLTRPPRLKHCAAEYLGNGERAVAEIVAAFGPSKRFVSGRTKAHELQDLLPWNWRDPSSSNAALAA
jgi:hypothetical protein